MENLNDVEFGVDENQEEAPILIAQRHLNIFRQVHIFNKAKRDQFDDELLALPDVVINYIKKMPGGRLLIEHLEDVKTKRGISFVKSSSEDFISPDDTSATPQQVVSGVPTQYVGGSLTMDANFADTFAKSMAEAFKQMPTPTINATGAPSVSGDFGQFFEMIAEEIRTSRSSLLDVLKETKNITDSVIASQVSISRILEGILSSQNKGDTDTATMNNRIIASQASITKLLENLYTSNTQKNDEVTAYLDVDNKLQDFRNQLEQTINNSLTSIVNHIYDTSNKQAADMAVLDIEKRLATFKSELEADILKSLAQLQAVQPVVNNRSIASTAPTASALPNNEFQSEDDISAFTEEGEDRKKKKKKKKKKNQDFVSDSAFDTLAATSSAEASSTDAIYEHSVVNEDNGKVEGVIHNIAYPHEDEFDNVDLDLPPLEDDNLLDTNSAHEISPSDDKLWVEGDGKGYPLNENSVDEENSSLDDLMDDGLDFALPEQNTEITEDNTQASEDVQSIRDFGSLDDLMNDGLDFALPEQNAEVTEEATPVEENSQSTQDLSPLDDLLDEDVATPEQTLDGNVDTTQAEEDVQPTQDLSSLDDLMDENVTTSEQTLDDEEDTTQAEEDVQPAQDLSSLDDLMDKDVAAPEQTLDGDEDTQAEEDIQPAQDLSSLDDLMDEDVASVSDETSDHGSDDEASLDDLQLSDTSSFDDSIEDADDLNGDDITSNETSESSGRYSAELDKIRAALTSDNIDISSLDEPIALDDYDDDANVSEDDDASYRADKHSDSVEVSETTQAEQESQSPTAEEGAEEDWEWEYVDENGNPIDQDENNTNDEDWEWEYVEDDSSATEDNNKPE